MFDKYPAFIGIEGLPFMDDKTFRITQELRERIAKLLKSCLVDTLKDEKLRKFLAMDSAPELPIESSYYKAREKSWYISWLCLANYALAQVAELSWCLTKKNPYSLFNRCMRMAQELAAILGCKTNRDISTPITS